MTPSFFWILLAVAVYGLLHSLLASLTAKTLAVRWLGEPGRRYYRPFFVFFVSVTLLPLLALAALLPDAPLYTIPMPWVLLTLGLQGLAAAGLLVGLAQTGALAFLGIDVFSKPQEQPRPPRLVTGGLYRLVRHPLYTCGLVILWLTPVVTWNILALMASLTAYILIGVIPEERKLLLEFGEAYAEYRRNTPMLIPKITLRPKSVKKAD